MKTYAVVSTPQQLRDKLVAYYVHKADVAKRNIAARSLKRDKDRDEYQSLLYMQIANELMEIEITGDVSGIQILNATFI